MQYFTGRSIYARYYQFNKAGAVTGWKAKNMSPRPIRCRKVGREPIFTFFKPAGVPGNALAEIVLSIDEMEAIRLKDYEELDQIKSAEKMGISQPTFQRIYNSARKKIADAMINGKAMRIEGGNYRIVGRRFGRGCGKGFRHLR